MTMTDALFIRILATGELAETPAELQGYRERIQSFVDKRDLHLGQEYVVKVILYPDEIDICLMQSHSRTRLQAKENPS